MDLEVAMLEAKNGDAAAMGLSHFLRDGQPQARASRLSFAAAPVEPVEGGDLVGHPGGQTAKRLDAFGKFVHKPRLFLRMFVEEKM